MAATQLYIMADEERHSAGLAHVIQLSEGKLQTGNALQIEPLTWPCDLDGQMTRAMQRRAKTSLEEAMSAVRY